MRFKKEAVVPWNFKATETNEDHLVYICGPFGLQRLEAMWVLRLLQVYVLLSGVCAALAGGEQYDEDADAALYAWRTVGHHMHGPVHPPAGYHMGQFCLGANKRQPYDTDIRIPMMIRGPGIRPGQRIPGLGMRLPSLSLPA